MSESAIESVTPDASPTEGNGRGDAPKSNFKTQKYTGDATAIIPIVMIGTGLYLIWFAIHYWRDPDMKWPTDPVKAILTGKGLPAATEQASWQSVVTTSIQTSDQSGSTPTGSTSGGAPTGGNTGAANPTAAQNQATAKMLATPYGWNTGPNWDDLIRLWNQESGWNNKAENPTSGAYGIPQSLPPSNMPKAAQKPPVGTSDAVTQIQWGLSYIKERYGSPSAAWQHEVAHNWY